MRRLNLFLIFLEKNLIASLVILIYGSELDYKKI